MPTANRANHTKAVGSPLSFAWFAVDQRTTTGNLTSDSLWTNVWNGENRRITIESRSTLTAAGKVKEQWTHLADGRWIERIVSTNNGTSYYPAVTNRYVWDGQILLAVLDHTNGLVLSFVRGLDLSGSIQGAGGVGGVLAVKAGPSAQCGTMTNTTHFTCYDGNGNMAALMNAATGAESARYETGPFAEPLRMTGPMAKLNPIRFSTQYHDDFTGDDKYVFRDLSDGRWLNRDPLGELGGKNLYGFVRNDGINFFDADGRITVTTVTKNPTTDCGSADVRWLFTLDKPAPDDGYIVQKVTLEKDHQSCDGKAKVKGTIVFWEAWPVKKGQTDWTGVNEFGMTDMGAEDPHKQAYGTISVTGEIKFFLKNQTGNLGDPAANPPVPPDPTTGFGGANGTPISGDLPSSVNEPGWWKNPSDNGETTGSRSLKTQWNCCCSRWDFVGPLQLNSTITVTPKP